MPRTASIAALSVLLAAALASGCAPADVAGNYTVATTNGANNCGANGWEEGRSDTGIPVVVTQDGATVQLIVNGLWGTALDLFVGSRTFNGTVGGSHVQADLIGSVPQSQGGCTYTYTLELDADLEGDVLQGQVAWRPVTNGHADCGILETCANLQLFNGIRPPRGG